MKLISAASILILIQKLRGLLIENLKVHNVKTLHFLTTNVTLWLIFFAFIGRK